MSPDPITTAASTAAIGVASAALAGAPPDPVVVAALAGSLCSAWLRPGTSPEWSGLYIAGTLIHTLLSFGLGLSGALLLPALYHDLSGVPAWALAFPTAAGTHQIIPSVSEIRAALVDRLRGRATAVSSSSSTTGDPK